MVFQRCESSDFERVDAFYAMVLAHLRATVNYPKWHDGHPCAQDVARAINSGTQYICTDGDEIVGTAVLSEDPEGDYEAVDWSLDLNRGEYLVIHTLAVHPDRARMGIGSYMVRECIRAARDGGYRSIRLDTVPDNHPANRLYLKNGFRYVGTEDLKRNIPHIPEFSLFELDL